MFFVYKKLQQALLALIACGCILIPQVSAQEYDSTPYVTRAEFLKYVMDINLDSWYMWDCDNTVFKDAKGTDWNTFCSAMQHGYITPNKISRADQPITVAEAAKIFVRATHPNEPMTCKDCRWYEPAVNFLAEKGELPLLVDRVTDFLTEQDVAFMLYKRYPEVDRVSVRNKVFREIFGSFQHFGLDGERVYLTKDKESFMYEFPAGEQDSFDGAGLIAYLKDKSVVDPGKELTTMRVALGQLCEEKFGFDDYFSTEEYTVPADARIYGPTKLPGSDYFAWVDTYGSDQEAGLILYVGHEAIDTNNTNEVYYKPEMSFGVPSCRHVGTVSFIVKNSTLITEYSDSWKGFSLISVGSEDEASSYISWPHKFFQLPRFSIHNYENVWSMKLESQYFVDLARTFEFFFDEKGDFKGYRIVKNGYTYYKPSGDFNYD